MAKYTKEQSDSAPTSGYTATSPMGQSGRLPNTLSNSEVNSSANQFYKAKFDVILKPSVKIVEIPLFTATSAIYDSLPIFPEVNILPLIGHNDKIKILFNSGIGEYRMDPIAIEPEDGLTYERIRTALNVATGAPLPYRSDDPPQAFQIFRTTQHPSKYSDFSGKLIKNVENNLALLKSPLSSNTFIDRVNPNEKYYYMFRAVDVHGNISNPSPIYRIEIVDDEGTIYLLLEVVEFVKKEKTQLSKDMKKLFNIVPRMSQSIVDGSSIKDFTTARGQRIPKVGLEQEGLWGKKFKIRLVSKKTGKKMDININFKTETLPEEIK